MDWLKLTMNRIFIPLLLSLLVSACGEDKPSFSLYSDQNIFQQSASTLNNKIDVLFVIDNSGSMAPVQQNLTNNFRSFIENFVTQGYDFKIAVTTTAAWTAPFLNDTSVSRWKDGSSAGHTGIYVIDPQTPNLINTFVTNATQGINGTGDERAFQSLKTSLQNSNNSDFRRDDAFLAIVIVSDEDDFSHDGSQYLNNNYSDNRLHSVQSYIDYLHSYTQSTDTVRKYSVSSIAIFDNSCLTNNSPWGIVGQRYGQITDATEGVKGSVCGNFAQTLESIQSKIAELSTQFYLNRQPVVSSIKVVVNGAEIFQNSTNGWSYNTTSNSVRFHGTAIPPQGSVIIVDFDPITIK